MGFTKMPNELNKWINHFLIGAINKGIHHRLGRVSKGTNLLAAFERRKRH